jgi:hypothetical protein
MERLFSGDRQFESRSLQRGVTQSGLDWPWKSLWQSCAANGIGSASDTLDRGTRLGAKRRTNFWRRCTIGLPRASRRSISERQGRCSTSSHELIVSLDAEFDRHSKFRLIRTSVLIFLLVEGTRRRYRPSPNPIGSDGRGAKREREAQKMDLFRTLVAEGSRSLQTALLATKSLRFNLWGETIE